MTAIGWRCRAGDWPQAQSLLEDRKTLKPVLTMAWFNRGSANPDLLSLCEAAAHAVPSFRHPPCLILARRNNAMPDNRDDTDGFLERHLPGNASGMKELRRGVSRQNKWHPFSSFRPAGQIASDRR